MTTQNPTSKNWWQRQSKLVKGIIIAVAVFVVLAIINGIAGGGDDDTDATASETTAQATQTTEDAPAQTDNEADDAPQPTTAEETPAAAPAPAIPGSDADSRCQPFDVTMISGILNDTTLTPTNGQVITDGEDQWIGATLMREDGKMESRSDVWLMNDDGLFAVTSGARNSTWAAPASKVGYSAGDEHAQAVDGCVVALTRQ